MQILVDYNQKFILEEPFRRRTGAVLGEIMRTEGVQLLHCTAGKDRTGWLSALLLVLGVPEAQVAEDFMASNTYMQAEIERKYQYLHSSNPAQADAMLPALGVAREVIDAGIASIRTHYGTVDTFFTDGMGISAATIDTFRRHMLRRA